jgi:outer membrane usher protein
MSPSDTRAIFLVCAVMCMATPVCAAPALLEVALNGKASGVVMMVTAQGGHLFVAAADFQKLNLSVAVPLEPRMDLAHVPGLEARIDETGQRLLLTLAASALPRQSYNLADDQTPLPEAQSASGAMLHYDLSATNADARNIRRGWSGGATLALDVFTPAGRFANTGFVTAAASGWQPVRLDSALIFENPQALSHLIIGDAITATQGWGRAVRFGGVEWGNDFSLRPGLVTQPLPAFFGQSEVPATVDVFSGAAKVYQQTIDPGPFELRNLPIVTGGGSATIVTRDVLGRETTQNIALYTDSGLLAPGLQSLTLDTGFLRTGYGRESFGYDTPVVSGDWRRGFSNTLTLRAHGEAAPNLALLSGGAEWGFGFGSIAADGAANNSGGVLAALSLQGVAGPLTLYGQAQVASRDWRDLAAIAPDGVAPSRLRYQLGGAWDLRNFGALGASWIGDKSDLLSASWSVQLPDDAFAALTTLRDMQSGNLSAQLSFNIAIGARGLAGLSVDHGVPSLRADAAGALVFLRGSLFAAHDPGGAVALVQTGEKNIHIYRENRAVAVSDADGEALLTGLDPWSPNRIAVESRDYDFDMLVEKTDAVVVPRAASGAVVDFTPVSHHPLLATVTRGIAMATPVGARVTLDGDAAPLPLGRDGQLFVADLQKPRGAMIAMGDKSCRVYIEPGQSAPLLCLREASGAY